MARAAALALALFSCRCAALSAPAAAPPGGVCLLQSDSRLNGEAVLQQGAAAARRRRRYAKPGNATKTRRRYVKPKPTAARRRRVTLSYASAASVAALGEKVKAMEAKIASLQKLLKELAARPVGPVPIVKPQPLIPGPRPIPIVGPEAQKACGGKVPFDMCTVVSRSLAQTGADASDGERFYEAADTSLRPPSFTAKMGECVPQANVLVCDTQTASLPRLKHAACAGKKQSDACSVVLRGVAQRGACKTQTFAPRAAAALAEEDFYEAAGTSIAPPRPLEAQLPVYTVYTSCNLLLPEARPVPVPIQKDMR